MLKLQVKSGLADTSMLRVYCDTGGFRKELVKFEHAGNIVLYQFKYENRNRHIKHAAVPSNPTWKQMNYTWDEMRQTKEFEKVTFKSLGEQSVKFAEILAIVGKANEVDAKHLDSAYASSCAVFLTSDKGDIWSKRELILSATGIVVLHIQADWPAFLALVESAV